jgi:hypothetical protein
MARRRVTIKYVHGNCFDIVDRTHCGGCNREFWTFPNFDAMSDAMHLRNALFPYIYTENHATRATGVSLVHPVYYEEGASVLDRAYSEKGSYMFGDSMLVAPVIEPIPKPIPVLGQGQRRQQQEEEQVAAVAAATITQITWLPPGDWVSWSGASEYRGNGSNPSSSESYSCGGETGGGDGGGVEVTASYGIKDMPIFVRAGSVVPLRTNRSLAQTVAFSDPLIWSVWPGAGSRSRSVPAAGSDSNDGSPVSLVGVSSAGNGSASVVEDDGATLRFETHNAIATTTMKWTWSTSTVSTASSSDSGDIAATAPATSLVLSVAPTVGSFDVQCSAEDGFEYAGPGADLHDAGAASSADGCCTACSSFSNCAYWTWSKDTGRCALKVSRRGRRANSSAVSGVAPRPMPKTRVYGFQVRTTRFASSPPSAVILNGASLPEITPFDDRDRGSGHDQVRAHSDAPSGWFVQPADAEMGLSRAPPGALVIFTGRMQLDETTKVEVVL